MLFSSTYWKFIKKSSKKGNYSKFSKSVTWLYQNQRQQYEKNGKKFVYAEPSDFLVALEIFANFFNLTYSGLDHRLQKCYETILWLQGKHDGEILSFGYESKYYGWVLRHKLMEELGIQSKNTIKNRIEKLKDFQLVNWHYDNTIPRGYLIQGIKQGISRVSLPVSMIALNTLLTGWLTGTNIYNKDIKLIDIDFLSSNDKKSHYVSEKLTPSKLTPSISPKVHTQYQPNLVKYPTMTHPEQTHIKSNEEFVK